MCGIVGYVGKKENAIHVLIAGLKALEYRGYDSAGIALEEEDKIKIIKSPGKIKNLEEKLNNNIYSLLSFIIGSSSPTITCFSFSMCLNPRL